MKSIRHLVIKLFHLNVYAAGTILLALMFANMYTGRPPGGAEILAIAAILLIAAMSWMGLTIWITQAMDQTAQEGSKDEKQAVDPWEFQRTLMVASGQLLPVFPTLNNGVLLYAALQMEELGETFEALAEPLTHAVQKQGGQFDGEYLAANKDISALMVVQLILRDHANTLQTSAKRVRELLQEFHVEIPLTTEEAAEILDGATDVVVTNAGFVLSAGLPGALAYREVGCSNLSKVNPTTGVIDKTPDGKWIKGAEYFKPDLARVIRDHQTAQP